jgi:peptide/nickel transport system permease protein
VAIAADATTVQRFRRSALGHSFLHTPSAMVGAVLLALLVLGAVFVPVIAAQNPYDLSRIFIDKAELPPFWLTDGEWRMANGPSCWAPISRGAISSRSSSMAAVSR